MNLNLTNGSEQANLEFSLKDNTGMLSTYSVCDEGYEWDYQYMPLKSLTECSKTLAKLTNSGYVFN